MEAIWLLLEHDRAWIEALPDDWWRRWTWYILRELHPHMSGESADPKLDLARLLHKRAPEAVRNTLLELATSAEAQTHNLLTPLLETMADTTDPELDRLLCDAIEAGSVSSDRVGTVARFVLSRDVKEALPVCLARLDRGVSSVTEESAIRAADALLSERTVESWDHVFSFLRDRPDLAPRILADFAHGREFRRGRNEEHSGLAGLTPSRAGQLVGLLLELFPPPDPKFDGPMARAVTPEDSVREMRTQLINWLSQRSDAEAILALRQLEMTYGAKHPWLRRPRSQAERLFRLSRWGAIPPQSVADVLDAGAKRLVRSERDALEGVREAVALYGRDLHHKSPSNVEDLWNIPKRGAPTPKAEERVSDKLCEAIRAYFQQFAVTADREVQVFRRKLARDLGGTPGSEVDVLVRVPAIGSVEGDAIVIPIEVKLSSNAEARTAIQEQLVGRYMSELGSSHGAFVVVWMDAPKLGKAYRPVWESMSAAEADLRNQAQSVFDSTTGAATVAVLVVDATLRTLSRPKANDRKSGHPAKPKSGPKRTGGTRKAVKPKGPSRKANPTRGRTRETSRAKKRR
jgi:hypothetical protein